MGAGLGAVLRQALAPGRFCTRDAGCRIPAPRRACGLSAKRPPVCPVRAAPIALVAAHPTLGWEKVVFEDPHVDVTKVMMSRVTHDPLIAYAQPGYLRAAILDPKRLSMVLLVHGAKDVRVRIDQAERMVQALRRDGKPVEYLAIEDMGHGMGYWVQARGAAQDRGFPAALPGRTRQPLRPVRGDRLGVDARSAVRPGAASELAQ